MSYTEVLRTNNRTLVYKLLDVDKVVIKPYAKASQNSIKISNAIYNNGHFYVTLLIRRFSDNIKRWIRSNDGRIHLQAGIMRGGHSRQSTYCSRTRIGEDNRPHTKQAYPSHCFTGTYAIDLDLSEYDLNVDNTIELDILDRWLIDKDINDGINRYDYMRTKILAKDAISQYPYIIYNIRFRYNWDPGTLSESHHILDSDEMQIYCTYEPINNGVYKIYEDSDFIVESFGASPWSYDSATNSFYPRGHSGKRSYLRIIPKDNSRLISFDVNCPDDMRRIEYMFAEIVYPYDNDNQNRHKQSCLYFDAPLSEIGMNGNRVTIRSDKITNSNLSNSNINTNYLNCSWYYVDVYCTGTKLGEYIDSDTNLFINNIQYQRKKT